MRELKCIRILASVFFAILIASPSYANTYYVDYEGGDDSNSGMSTARPFQHSPGDPHAKERAASTILQPGDTIVFKGGTLYRGALVTTQAGEAGAPIIYDGNVSGRFGDGPAIIDGSESISGWKECGVAGGLQTYCAPLPEDVPGTIIVYQGTQRASYAQLPLPSDYYAYDNVSEFYEVDQRLVSSSSIVATEIASFLADGWLGARLHVWGVPNTVYDREIRSYNPNTGSAQFSETNLYGDRPTRFALYNHPAALRALGQYVVSNDKKTIRLIPFSDFDPKGHEVTISVRQTGIEVKHPYIHVHGFIVQKYIGDRGGYRDGAGIRVSGDRFGGSLNGVRVLGNEVRYNSSHQEQGAITVVKAPGVVVSGNNIHHNTPNRGILISDAEGAITIRNVIHRNGGTGIAYFGSVNGEIIDNKISEIIGNHSNGISLYLGSHDSVVCGNNARSRAIALTTKHSQNLLFAFNVLEAYDDVYTVADWGSGGGRLRYYNNLIINSYSKGFYVNEGSREGLEVYNNVIDGALSWEGDVSYLNNVYTSLGWNQAQKYGWTLGDGEIQMMKGSIYTESANITTFRPAEKARDLLQKGREVDLTACGVGTISYIGVPYLAPPKAPKLWLDGANDGD